MFQLKYWIFNFLHNINVQYHDTEYFQGEWRIKSIKMLNLIPDTSVIQDVINIAQIVFLFKPRNNQLLKGSPRR